MPFTFFAHQVLVLPLKWAKPRWFDGTALCVGSAAPDLAYALSGALDVRAHTLHAQFWWTVPVSYALTRVIREQIALPLSAQLPAALGAEVASLARGAPALWVSLLSAWIGGLSHIFLDGFTHAGGWAVDRYAGLRAVVIQAGSDGITAARLCQYTGHVVGTILGFGLFSVLLRRGKLSAWQSDYEARQPEPRARRGYPAFGRIVQAGCCLAMPAALSATITPGGIETALMRATITIALAVWLACRLSAASPEVA